MKSPYVPPKKAVNSELIIPLDNPLAAAKKIGDQFNFTPGSYIATGDCRDSRQKFAVSGVTPTGTQVLVEVDQIARPDGAPMQSLRMSSTPAPENNNDQQAIVSAATRHLKMTQQRAGLFADCSQPKASRLLRASKKS
ncbi:MAG: hypothetical protein PW843_08860 [Azospirillaceae bacterium]|nr:hypothetical protein [Azospirillaceae bacterium]